IPSEGETETTDKTHEESETNTNTSPTADTVAQEDCIQPETTAFESPVEPQVPQGLQMPKDQPRIPPHPLSPHSSTTMTQTVVVTPLSRPGFQPVSPLPADGSDRAALNQRLAQLEREAKRLKRILGIREPEVAMVTEAEGGGPSDVTLGDSVSCDQNVERLNPMSNESRREELSVCQVRTPTANQISVANAKS
ncbi:hypothetical protein M9458_028779, partial [Cirrhinus mrigala]